MGQDNTKHFDLAAILTVTTGKLFTGMNNLYDILNYLTGESLFTHQIPEALQKASRYVLNIYPQLREVSITDEQIRDMKTAKRFIAEQKRRYGKRLPLIPMQD